MSSRRVTYYGAIGLTALILLCSLIIKRPGILPWGKMVVAPASVDGVVTISTSPDKKLTFITCVPNYPPIWRRLLHSTLTCAFVVQHFKPTRNAIAHAGSAHIEFQRHLLSVVFSDSSRFVFTTASEDPAVPGAAEVDYGVGLATHLTAGLSTHADFIGSRDWIKLSCKL
jgi:hypothetical protein